MKKIALITSFLCLVSAYALAFDPNASVVKILAGNNAGTGFVWQGQDQKYIVTSLHTLVGQSDIFHTKLSASTELVVYKADLESDLALLIPKQGTLNQPALDLDTPAPKNQGKYYIYGFPAGVKLAQGDSIEFSRATHNVPMESVLPYNVVKDVTASGYPTSSVKILRVSSGITPGHSGAPIIDDVTQKVIGIGAGGLSKKGYRRVNWAIPAAEYLSEIEKSGAALNVVTMQAQSSDYKHSVATGEEAVALESDYGRYYLIYQVSMFDLVESEYADDIAEGDEKALEAFNTIVSKATELNYDIKNTTINIYQHQDTGSMVYLPASVEFIVADPLLFALGPTERVGMYMQISSVDTSAQAFALKDAFATQMKTLFDLEWQTVAEHSLSEPYDAPEYGEWEDWISLYHMYDTDDESLLELNLSIKYGEGYADFFGYGLVGIEWIDHNEKEDALIHQLQVCMKMSGFVML